MAYRYRSNASKSSPPPEPDGRTRILDAAIELYGDHGFDAVTLKDIATRSAVSAPLVIHHFGSTAGLRQACDQHVTEAFRQAKVEGVRHEGPMPRHYALEAIHANQHLLKYMLQAFAAGGKDIDALFDRLVDDSLEYTAEAEALGLVYPSAHPRNRAVVLLLQSFGSLMLHKQLKRQLGASPIDDPPEALLPYMATVLELYTKPVINGEMYEELMASQRDFEQQNPTDHRYRNNAPDHTEGPFHGTP